MIVVNGVVRSTREDIAALHGAISALESASREESGCLDYTFSVELNDPDVIRITEKWESVDALLAHFRTPHMEEFQSAMGARPPQSMDIKIYEVEEIQPF